MHTIKGDFMLMVATPKFACGSKFFCAPRTENYLQRAGTLEALCQTKTRGLHSGARSDAMTAPGLHLANARHDPNYQKSGEFLASMRDALDAQAATL